MDALLQDLRYAIRTLSRAPGLSSAAILTLGIGIAATTTMFSLVYAALLRPLPFDRPGQLAMLYVSRTTPRDGTIRLRWSFAEIRELPAALTSFESLGSFSTVPVNLTTGGDAEQITAEVASAGYFRVLHSDAAIGRTLRDADERDTVAVISDTLWQRRFGRDPSIVGRAVGVNDTPATVVGVMPRGFAGLSGRAELWIPPAVAARLTYHDYLVTPQHFINVVGRLRPGATIDGAAAELATVAPRVVRPERVQGTTATWSATALSLATAHVDQTVKRLVLTLLAAVACVLLITCVNIACLLLARGTSRRGEIAIRLAIGSGRGRIVRQLVTESLVLALAGGVVGIIVAMWLVDVVPMPAVAASAANEYAQLGAFSTPTFNSAVLLFAFGAMLATALVFGLGPALEISRPDIVGALKLDTRSGGAATHRLLSSLVVTELTLAVLLLGVAGLLIRSFVEIQDQRHGFAPDAVMTFYVTPPASRYPPSEGPKIVERLLTAIRSVPGVDAASVNRCGPFDARCARTTVFFADRPTAPGAAPVVGRHYVSADYFRALGIPLRAGRVLRDDDREGRPPVAVVDETAARRFWPDESPIGKRVWFGGGTGFSDPLHAVEIVGVVGNVKYGLPDDAPLPHFYTSYLQFTYPDTMVLVKTTGSFQAIVPALRAAVARVDPGLPLYDIQPLEQRLSTALARPRLMAAALALFAIAALLLATFGVYGVTSYAVSCRHREMGIRLALGANRRDVMSLVVGQGARLAVAGGGLGLLAAIAAGRMIRALLFSVAPDDPAVLATTLALMTIVALAAAFVPARRAGTIEPAAVLRSE